MRASVLSPAALFPARAGRAWHYLSGFPYPWEALAELKSFLLGIGHTLDPAEYDLCGENIWISHTADVAESAFLQGPCIIEAGAQLRHGAFLRGSVLVGRGAVVGNSCELKNCILFDEVQVPHFNYVGDSILGHRAHLGAGAITSNVKGDRSEITVRADSIALPTGLRKLGAMLGDGAEIGCNTVLNPGTIVAPNARIYPLTSVRGYIPEGCIYKGEGRVVKRTDE